MPRCALVHPIEFNIQEELSMSPKSFRLMQYHQHIDTQLRAEIKRRWPDMPRIQKLKKLKLKVKDRLASMAGIQRSAIQS
jgi:hypothetical protein